MGRAHLVHPKRYAVVSFSALLAATVAACGYDPAAPGGQADFKIAAAKAASTDISVSGATPDSATQDTTLDVVISGSGFVAGAAANWALAGVQDPAQVRTNSTRYVSSRQLVANITISSTATIAKWDVVVTAAGKKGGIGTEMFAIKTKALAGACGRLTTYLDSRVRLEWSSLSDLGSSSGMTNDGLGAYEGGIQSVKALLTYHDASCARGGDVIFDPDANSGSPARTLRLYFPVGNDAGLPSTGVNAGPYATIPALMELGSDVTWDPDNPTGRDANIEAKYPGIPRTIEHPALSGETPDYPSGAVAPIFQSLGISGCERLQYEKVRLTRIAGLEGFEQLVGQRASDGSPLGRWTPLRNGVWVVESVDTGTPAGHAAQCITSKRGSLVANGTPMNMPFRVIISELP